MISQISKTLVTSNFYGESIKEREKNIKENIFFMFDFIVKNIYKKIKYN